MGAVPAGGGISVRLACGPRYWRASTVSLTRILSSTRPSGPRYGTGVSVALPSGLITRAVSLKYSRASVWPIQVPASGASAGACQEASRPPARAPAACGPPARRGRRSRGQRQTCCRDGHARAAARHCLLQPRTRSGGRNGRRPPGAGHAGHRLRLFLEDPGFAMACRFGTAACRGVVTGTDWMRADLRARYRGWFSWWLQQKIKQTQHHPGR